MEEDKMGRAGSNHEKGERNAYRVLVGKRVDWRGVA
jgi:hypothetical protein